MLSWGLHAQNSLVINHSYFENSIISGAENSTNHKTLARAAIAADLDRVLDSDGPFTVFAPVDSAFKKFTTDQWNSLLHPSNKSALKSLLTYHIVAGKLSASKILLAMSRGGGIAKFRTVQGNWITAKMVGIDIVLSDNLGNQAKIITADSGRCNGVVHIIDNLIYPEKL